METRDRDIPYRKRSGYLPRGSVNSAKFITIYREFGWPLVARSSGAGGLRRMFCALFTGCSEAREVVVCNGPGLRQ